GRSFNGRTADSGSAYRGSNPCLPAINQGVEGGLGPSFCFERALNLSLTLSGNSSLCRRFGIYRMIRSRGRRPGSGWKFENLRTYPPSDTKPKSIPLPSRPSGRELLSPLHSDRLLLSSLEGEHDCVVNLGPHLEPAPFHSVFFQNSKHQR